MATITLGREEVEAAKLRLARFDFELTSLLAPPVFGTARAAARRSQPVVTVPTTGVAGTGSPRAGHGGRW